MSVFGGTSLLRIGTKSGITFLRMGTKLGFILAKLVTKSCQMPPWGAAMPKKLKMK